MIALSAFGLCPPAEAQCTPANPCVVDVTTLTSITQHPIAPDDGHDDGLNLYYHLSYLVGLNPSASLPRTGRRCKCP